ncbi:MAG: hypothetical protein WA409_08735, partial [Candidatus Binatus sp.]
NLIRGCDPQPGAFASVGDKRMRLYEATFSATRSQGEPGTIAAIDANGMKIALAGGTITVKRARIDPSPNKVAPAELIATGDLKVGARLT